MNPETIAAILEDSPILLDDTLRLTTILINLYPGEIEEIHRFLTPVRFGCIRGLQTPNLTPEKLNHIADLLCNDTAITQIQAHAVIYTWQICLQLAGLVSKPKRPQKTSPKRVKLFGEPARVIPPPSTRQRHEPPKNIVPKTLIEKFLEQRKTVFTTAAFFEFVLKTGLNVRIETLIRTPLRKNCIRIDKTHWIGKDDFQANSSLTESDYSEIARRLLAELGDAPFFPLGTVKKSFFKDFPQITLFGKQIPWNNYLLTSISALLISELNIVNDQANSFFVTAVLVPRNLKIRQSEVIGYVLEQLQDELKPRGTVDKIYNYLSSHKIRLTRNKKITAVIERFLSRQSQ